ncbi:MAG: type IV pilus assembly protein PilM [Desulfobacteraceae bacterium]|nr:type IV pilus assembly protein PilM [Desulfobacteraceae bacterium]
MSILNVGSGSKKKSLVGLDIGSHSIKVVEIEHSKLGRILRNFGMIATPQDAIVEGSVKDVEAVSAAIRSLFKNLGIKNKNVAASLSGYSVIAKKIVLDEMEESEMEKAIRLEAEKYIPYGINEVNLDYTVLNAQDPMEESSDEKADSGSSDKMDVLLVAGKNDVIDEYVELIQAANLNLGVVDIDVFAIQNAAEISLDKPEGNYAIITVGASELGINAVHSGLSVFSRDSSYGGTQITKAIMSEFDVPFEEAESMKLGGVGLDDDKIAEIEKIIASKVLKWVSEIKHALDFVANTYPDETIEEIFLSGGSSETPGFKRHLEKETEIPVTGLNPFKYLVANSKFFDPDYLQYIGPQACVAVGLALRSLGDK